MRDEEGKVTDQIAVIVKPAAFAGNPFYHEYIVSTPTSDRGSRIGNPDTAQLRRESCLGCWATPTQTVEAATMMLLRWMIPESRTPLPIVHT
jgi:hypothetical protein